MLRTFRLLTVALLALSLLWLASANRDASTASAQAASVGKIFVAIDAGEALADAALYSLDADGSNQTKLFGFHGHPADGSGTGLELKSSDGIGIKGVAFGVSGKSSLGAGVWGDSANRPGVWGTSNAASGVVGFSTDNAGVGGVSENDGGVMGSSTNGAGVYGTGAITGTVGIVTNTTGDARGVYGESASPDGVSAYGTSPGTAVSGFSNGTSGIVYGVRGRSDSSEGTGVFGIANASSGNSIGVYGKTNSLNGKGVYGEGGYYGLDGVGTDSTGLSFGVYAETSSPATGSNGVKGLSRATNGITYGVFGQSNSPNGYGVYSDGKMHVNGNLSWKAITRTLSLPPAAFVPGIGADSHPHADITSPFIYIPSSPKALTMRRLGFDDPGWGRYISTGGLSSCSQNDMFHFRRW